MPGTWSSECILVFECSDTGAITNVLHDPHGELTSPGGPKSFLHLLHPISRGKGRAFFREMTTTEAAFGWELFAEVAEEPCTLMTHGLKYGETYLIVADGTGGSANPLIEDMLRMIAEQANQLRTLAQDQVASRAQTSMSHYDELSRLNNDLANLQRELARKNADLERLHALKDQFLGMAAHDLRSPLDVIMMYSEFIRAEASDVLGEEHRAFLDIIQQSSQFMFQLVNTLLDVSLIESGQLVMTPQLLNLVPLVEQNAAINAAIARRKSIRVAFEASQPQIMVLIDPDRLHQVLNNLLNNAIKFSMPGTQIAVSVEQAAQDARITVHDEGQGIPADQLDTLFDVYSKRSSLGTEGEKGSGLGLAITKKIILESHGTIVVESQPGVGTLFIITLPIQQESQAEHHE